MAARRSTLEARKQEAAEDKDGIGTEGEALPGEVYSAEREWVSEEFQGAYAEQKGQANESNVSNTRRVAMYIDVAYCVSFSATYGALGLSSEDRRKEQNQPQQKQPDRW